MIQIVIMLAIIVPCVNWISKSYTNAIIGVVVLYIMIGLNATGSLDKMIDNVKTASMKLQKER